MTIDRDISDTIGALSRARVAIDNRELTDPDVALTSLSPQPKGDDE